MKPPTTKTNLITRIAYAKDLTSAKLSVLREMSRRCGRVRKEAWHRYGSIAALGRTPRERFEMKIGFMGKS